MADHVPSSALITKFSLSFFLLLSACDHGRHAIPIDRSINKNKGSKNGGKTASSTKGRELLKTSSFDCPDMARISEAMEQGDDDYTLYIRNVDLGTLTKLPGKTTDCMPFQASSDEITRVQQIFSKNPDGPQAQIVRAGQLDTSLIGLFLRFKSQEKCAAADITSEPMNPAMANSPLADTRLFTTWEAVCSGSNSITLRDNKTAEVRNYTISDDELVVTVFRPQNAALTCGAQPSDHYVATTYAAEFGTISELRLNFSMGALIDKHLAGKVKGFNTSLKLKTAPPPPPLKKSHREPKPPAPPVAPPLPDLMHVSFPSMLDAAALIQSGKYGKVECSPTPATPPPPPTPPASK